MARKYTSEDINKFVKRLTYEGTLLSRDEVLKALPVAIKNDKIQLPWIIQEYELTIEDIDKHFPGDIMHFLYDTEPRSYCEAIANLLGLNSSNIFQRATEANDVEYLTLLLRTLNIGSTSINLVSKHAAIKGHLSVLQLLNDRIGNISMVKAIDKPFLLELAAKYGHFEVVKWLIEEYNITKEQAFNGYCDPVKFAALNGYLDIAKWLTEKFNLTVLDIESFQYTAKNGGLDILKWMTEHFKLTKEFIAHKDYRAFCWAAKRGHLSVVQWMAEYFNLTAEDVFAKNNHAFRGAVKYGRDEVCAWMVSKFGLEKLGWKGETEKMLRIVAKEGYAEQVFIPLEDSAPSGNQDAIKLLFDVLKPLANGPHSY